MERIGRIAVVGAGTMGLGIAQVAAAAGLKTALFDVADAALERARAQIVKNLNGAIARDKISEADRDATLERLSFVNELHDAAEGADVVVEAIVENLDAKRRVFEQLEAIVEERCVLASNTSSLPLAQIAAPLQFPQRVIGLHFFNPVHIMKLLEVVVHKETADAVRDRSLELAKVLGKEPIVVSDSPGFASSRLGVVLGLEAMRMVEQNVASAEDIDKAMTLGYKHPMGPLKLTDLVGLDIRLAIAETLHRELKGAQYEPPKILREKVKAGELGKKTGQGFYTW